MKIEKVGSRALSTHFDATGAGVMLLTAAPIVTAAPATQDVSQQAVPGYNLRITPSGARGQPGRRTDEARRGERFRSS